MSTRATLPFRSLAGALALGLLLPVAAAAQDSTAESDWPTADELRLSLQAIGYEFAFEPQYYWVAPEWSDDLPTGWTLTQPSVIDDVMPEEGAYDTLTLRIGDFPGKPAQLVFGAVSMDQADGELETITSVLMETAARLPDDAGLDAAVWFMSNIWLNGDAEGATTLPCLVQEFDGGAMVVWRGGDGEGIESIGGSITHFDDTSFEVEQCKALQAGIIDDPMDTIPSEDAATSGDETTLAAADYSVPPAEAVELIEAGDHTIIDVRTPAEFEQAHVVGAVNIDVEAPDFAARIAELDPDEPYLVYCRTGRRSDLAAQQMAAAGFSDITDGAGLADLARAGAPVE